MDIRACYVWRRPSKNPFKCLTIYCRSPSRKNMCVLMCVRNGLVGSAICVFSLAAVQEVFSGKFKEQATSSSAWLPVLTSKVPEPRPGLCVNDTQTLPDSVLNFIRSHPLMDSAVPHDHGRPAFFRRDVTFTSLVVDLLEVDGVAFTVYFAGTMEGTVYKLAEWSDRSGEVHTNLVDIFEVTTPEPVRAMEISTKFKSLYVSSDSVLRQVDLLMCRGRYANCLRCIQDPYCGWDRERGECKPYSKAVRVFWGRSVHLSCGEQVWDPEELGLGPLRWFHYSRDRGKQPVPHVADKFLHTADHGLVLMAATERDAGLYACKLGLDTLCSFNITIDSKTCNVPSEADYKRIYSDWCHEFEKYKTAMKTWQNKQA
ncbi:Sema-2a, partial [Cordylochernes scorpioides]